MGTDGLWKVVLYLKQHFVEAQVCHLDTANPKVPNRF